MRRFHSYGPVNIKLHYYAPRTELIEKAYLNLVGETPAEGGQQLEQEVDKWRTKVQNYFPNQTWERRSYYHRMADMTKIDKKKKKKLSEEEIDDIVISQADNDSEWEESIQVRKTKPTNLSIPANLAARAAFLAHLHREPGIEEWIMRIIRERIELEEVAFVEAKRELIARERV